MVNRPLRENLESATSKVPEGPYGVLGNGGLVGAVGFGVITFANNFSPLPLGYTVESHNIDRGSDKELHKIRVWSLSRDVAKFVAKTEATGPNINMASDRATIDSVGAERERKHFTLWSVHVSVDRGDGSVTSTSYV